MNLQWNPTPYRKRTDDEYADVDGFGRFRVSWHKEARGFTLVQNNERIGSLHRTAALAKDAAEGIVAATRGTEDASKAEFRAYGRPENA